ncbi:calcineurin-like phosphoesterase family protein [Chitinophaga nivalis]|uniref:Calcineurin-like phosphoesterase family protein n=1 Tax=Chitinophaga nivalis TaxID=2991709 RepID=A0ABT3IJY4_9BACT|nr:calcineurin-like phosphoesterase family protein [Chitinophaga nivalis]MCW3466037.1 calcineurin-like phosphoesterase family protein [Chitinophaga nivalis]MCW3484272.1 calcineurin-like phosphoesterase family protein [Chitinophaga nivalis]
MLNRRSFLRNVGITGSLLTAPSLLLKAQPAATAGNIDLSSFTLKGKVLSQGKGIANVSVTDGINITQTDKNGQYELVSNATATLVYISVPAGYAIPEQNSIAAFYQPINKNNRTAKYDFHLSKLTVDDRKHNFVVWADTQMISKADAEQLKAQTVPDLQALLQSYPKETLFHGIGCGDLVWDHFELYEDYKAAIAMCGIPFYNVIGNHDMDLDARTDDHSTHTFKQQFGPTYYSFNRGDIHYVVLDDVFFIGVDKKYIGYLTENQLQWLEQDLALVKPGSTVVVSLHIPTFTGAARREKKEPELGGMVTNRKQLYKLLAPFKTHIMSGHTHFNDNWEEGNIMEHNHGTVCGAWWTGPICGDGTPSGYGVYEVDGADIKWYYKSTGFPKEKQVRVYPKGKVKNAPEEIAANVWNWDNKWKVEWYADGVLQGPMEQRVANDPWAEELYAGPQLPKKHKFVEPMLNDHMFFAKPAANVQKITVKATDRFGNVYEDTIG